MKLRKLIKNIINEEFEDLAFQKKKTRKSIKEGRFTDYPPSNPEELPHYTPVNPNQSIDDILADVPDSTGNYQSTPTPDPSVQTSQQSQIPQSSRNDGEWGSMDLGNMLMQRVMQQQGQPGLGFDNNGSSTPNMDALQNTQLQPQQEPQMVMVKEGAPSYRKLETKDFGSDMTLVKSMGPLQGIGGKEFETKGEKNCYLADGQDRIDLSEVSPENMLKLVEVHAPFVGAVMVPKEHVMKATSPGPKVLGD